jgi:WXXGXW repeat (2 copies)
MVGHDMRKVAAGLISIFLMYGAGALAQSASSTADPDFPTKGFLQVPPHFQPRPMDAAHIVTSTPPPIPSYAQPAMPEEGYLWMPGFWARRDDVRDYYWVPGTWVKPPRAGLLWTPPYWRRVDDGYAFHDGYWAQEVGFYGGVDYGYGYTGDGYQGGRWDNGSFFYNSAANNFGSLSVAHTYNQAMTPEDHTVRAGFDGGKHGTKARPTAEQERLSRGTHLAPTAEQTAHFEMAAKDRSLYAKLNGGEPGIAATARAGVFVSSGITRSSERATNDAHATTGADLK